MFARFQKGSQNCVALFGVFQAYALQVLVQDALRFANHFPRNAGLVINAFL